MNLKGFRRVGRRRALTLLVCMALGCLFGAMLGGGMGVLAVRLQNIATTGELADLWVARADRISSEAVGALETINQSPDSPCSDTDIARLRQIVMSSQFLKGAGRIAHGAVVCTSTMGRLATPIPRPVPNFKTNGKRTVYLNAAVDGVPDVKAMVIEEGTAQISINRNAYAVLVDPRLDYLGVSVHGGANDVFMSSDRRFDIGALVFAGRKDAYLDGHRYEIRCSHRFTGCIVARLIDAPGIRSPVLLGFIGLGMLLGLGGGWSAAGAWLRAQSISARLRRALRQRRLRVVYQPIVRLADRTIVGAEALLRWNDDEGHPVSPEVFVAVAQEDGFIDELTLYVVHTVCSEWRSGFARHHDFRITINVEASNLLEDRFFSAVASTLARAAIRPEHIGFELTERRTANLSRLQAGIKRLRSNGHRLYIDDFGTDYSSLSYLADLKVDAVKLDRSFSRGIPFDEKIATLVAQIVGMMRTLELDVIAEGIELHAQATFFDDLGPRMFAQGWLFSESVPAAVLLEMLDGKRRS